jgi:hypothetical protein
VLTYPAFVMLAFAAFALTPARLPWLKPLLRIFIGLAFAEAVCDRLGLFGKPGAPGVSWGNFANFTAYTAQVNLFLPKAMIPSLAIVETVIEGSLGIAMTLGVAVKRVCLASAVLLCAFAIAMSVSLGFGSRFPFAVPVLAGGAFLLAASEDSARWSLESRWHKSKGLLTRRLKEQTDRPFYAERQVGWVSGRFGYVGSATGRFFLP